MQRNILTLALGASMIGAAALAACSGGGGSGSSTPVVSTPANAPGSTVPSNVGPLGSSQITLTIDRTPHVKAAQATRRGAKGTRKPAYISNAANGLQVAVSTTGASPTTRTIYADLSTTSPLCTFVPTGNNVNGRSGNFATCTITVPTLAASEQIVATEVDNSPTGLVNGYGTGFPTGTNILAAGTLAANTTPGTKSSLTLGLGAVSAAIGDCTNLTVVTGPGIPTGTPANFGVVPDANNSFFVAGRIVVTAGVASEGIIEPAFIDAAGSDFVAATPAPFADVNGSPTPITFAVSSSAITLSAIPNNGTPGPYAVTASIPSDSYVWDNCIFVVDVKVAATLSGNSATITLNNNLTAPNPFLSPPASYASTFVYTLAAVSASAVTGTVAVTGGTTGQVTGTDFMAVNGMIAGSVAGSNDGNCLSGSSATLATVAQMAPINTSTWQQVFTITPMTAGACTFVLSDMDSNIPTQAIHVTVNP